MLSKKKKLKSEGIQLGCAEEIPNYVAENRVKKGIPVSRRIRWAPFIAKRKPALLRMRLGQTDQFAPDGSGGSSVEHETQK